MKRLRIHDVVSILVSDAKAGRSTPRTLDAVVLAFSDRGVALDLITKALVLRLPEVISDALLVGQGSDALVGLRGTIVLAQPAGHLRFIVAEAISRRREGTRIGYEMPVALSRMGSDRTVEGETVTIGADGFTAAADIDAEVGDSLTVSFAPASGRVEQTTGTAKVVSATDGLLTLKFDLGSGRARTELGDIVVAQSRAHFNRKHKGSDFDLVF